MNYKSQLKGWGIDRALEFYKLSGSAPSLEDITQTAEKLMNFAYVADEDFTQAVAGIGELIKASTDPMANVEQLLQELEFLKEQISAQAAKVQPIGKAN